MKYIVFAIIGIVLFSGIAVMINYNSVTGLNAGNYVSRPSLYGGGLRKAMQDTPRAFGKDYAQSRVDTRYQQFMYANTDKWDCSFGKEAESSPYPCIFEPKIGKYCCVVDSAPLTRS